MIDVGGPANGEEHGARNQLASDCAADGTYTGMLCASPLNLAGAAASPANVLVVK